MNDREWLRTFARQRSAGSFRPVIERYLPFVYSAAYRQAGDAARAVEATRAVFLALSYKARQLPRKTVLAAWLFQATRCACLKLMGKPKRGGRLRSLWIKWKERRPDADSGSPPPLPYPISQVPVVPPILAQTRVDLAWNTLAPELNDALARLPAKQRDAVLLRTLLNWSWEDSAQTLRTSEKRAKKRVARALAKLVRRLRKRGCATECEGLAAACAAEGCAVPLPEEFASDILMLVEKGQGRRPSIKLARRTLRSLYWAPWRRRCKVAAVCLSVFLVFALLAGLSISYLWRNGPLMAWLVELSVLHEAKSVPRLAEPARPWPTDPAQPRLRADAIRAAADLYQTTNLWLADLKLSPDQWKALQPRHVAPLPGFFQPDGTVLLRNPKARRSGLSGVLGFDFDWAHGELEFGGVHLADIRVRMKGNGTYLSSLSGWKRSFKVGLRKLDDFNGIGGIEEINFTNLIDDRSYMSDALAYELFRDAGVPAPRTAYGWLALSVAGQWERKPLGLYLLVQNLDRAFAMDWFGSRKTPIFKPVTYKLFEDLGDQWSAYADIYDLKTKATAEQRRRVIEFARLVSHADDSEFGRRLGEFLDLDEFARFLACLVLLSSYDGLLSDGQNFYVYLHPGSNKFGFIPWDLDHAWGGFYLIATSEERARASIWHPWVGQNRFLERVLAVDEFRRVYRARLDELARLLRSPIAAESSFRLERFEQAVSAQWLPRSLDRGQMGPDRPAHQLKRFIEVRAKSVRQQLDGKSKGMILSRRNG